MSRGPRISRRRKKRPPILFGGCRVANIRVPQKYWMGDFRTMFLANFREIHCEHHRHEAGMAEWRDDEGLRQLVLRQLATVATVSQRAVLEQSSIPVCLC